MKHIPTFLFAKLWQEWGLTSSNAGTLVTISSAAPMIRAICTFAEGTTQLRTALPVCVPMFIAVALQEVSLPALVKNAALFSVWCSRVHLNLHLLACVNKCCTGNVSTSFVTPWWNMYSQSIICPSYVVTLCICHHWCFIPSKFLLMFLESWRGLLY